MGAQDEQRVQSTLEEVRVHIEAGRYDEAQLSLKKGEASGHLGTRGEKMLAEIIKHRQERVNQRFNDAVEKEKMGDLDAAADHTLYVLSLSLVGDQSNAGIVNFARLLGMKLYSAGELSRAKELWSRALDIDPGNQKLESYLKEVETRLDNLDRIKKGEADDDGN